MLKAIPWNYRNDISHFIVICYYVNVSLLGYLKTYARCMHFNTPGVDFLVERDISLLPSTHFQRGKENKQECERTYRLSPVSWSISVTGIFRSRSSWCGESFDCWRDNRSEWAARRFRASFDRGIVAFDLINDEVVVVCTSGTSKELLDDGLADPVDNSSFWASLFSFIFTPSSPSSARRKKRKKIHMKYLLRYQNTRLMTLATTGAVRLRLWI